jgi:hypothetical protein
MITFGSCHQFVACLSWFCLNRLAYTKTFVVFSRIRNLSMLGKITKVFYFRHSLIIHRWWCNIERNFTFHRKLKNPHLHFSAEIVRLNLETYIHFFMRRFSSCAITKPNIVIGSVGWRVAIEMCVRKYCCGVEICLWEIKFVDFFRN